MAKPRSASQAPITFRPSRSRDAERARSAAHGGSARDWAGLGDGPAGLIAERVLADDVVAYVCFRAVCRSWRLSCDAPRGGGGVLEDPRLRPRQWVMLVGETEKLDAAERRRRQFLNVSTGQCIQVDVPELRDHGVPPFTAGDGLLFLHCYATGAVRLLNPLTRQTADLPPVSTLTKTYHGRYRCNFSLADDNTVVLNFYGAMAFAKPGDERWATVKSNTGVTVMSSLFFAGRFYGIVGHAIMTADLTRRDEPRLVTAAVLGSVFRGWNNNKSVHLVDNGGKLVLVHRTFHRGTGHKRAYKVYRVDLEAGKVTTRGGAGLSLGGRAVFVGSRRALSVSPRAFPSIDANTVYPGISMSERGGSEQIGAYRIRDGRTESFGYDSENVLPRPWSIADFLATYVSVYDHATR